MRNNKENLNTLFQFPIVVMTCKTRVQYHNQHTDIDIVKMYNISITTKIPPVTLLEPHPLPLPSTTQWVPAATNLFSIPIIFSRMFWKVLYTVYIQCITFGDWLFYSAWSPWRYIFIVVSIIYFFLLPTSNSCCGWTTICTTIHPNVLLKLGKSIRKRLYIVTCLYILL